MSIFNYLPRGDIAQALWAQRRAWAVVILFSMVVSVLLLTPTLYMLQVYDRVMVSHSELTLLVVSLVNIWNFMDGINGLATTQALLCALGVFLLLRGHDLPGGGFLLRVPAIDIAEVGVAKARGLAEFVDTITGTIPSDWMIDMTTALSLVKLADMQKALGAGLRHGHSQPLVKAAGDFDFF